MGVGLPFRALKQEQKPPGLGPFFKLTNLGILASQSLPVKINDWKVKCPFGGKRPIFRGISYFFGGSCLGAWQSCTLTFWCYFEAKEHLFLTVKFWPSWRMYNSLFLHGFVQHVFFRKIYGIAFCF